MRRLVIDCATPALSLALFDESDCIASHHELLGRGHAEALVPRIRDMMDGTAADEIAVDVGPGSFTGIRVGLAAARALAFAWQVPATGFGCLPLCAAIARADHDAGDAPITVVMVGGHGELFWQRFDGTSLAPLFSLQSTQIETLAGELNDKYIYGSAAELFVVSRGWGEAVPVLPHSARYGLLPADARGLPPTALYGRGADAKPMAAALPS